MKKKLVLGILFILPVMFLLIMLSSKHYYNPLDVMKEKVPELTAFHTADRADTVSLKGHITVLMLFNDNPLHHLAEISNVNEKAYKWAMGYKGFQVVFVIPEEYTETETVIKQKLGEYVDLKYWQFVFGTPAQIESYFNEFKGGVADATYAMNDHFYVVDKENNLRGRKDDEGKGLLYGYNATSIAELHKKVVPDLRILFQEYRDKRNGKFDSDQRRLKELKHEE